MSQYCSKILERSYWCRSGILINFPPMFPHTETTNFNYITHQLVGFYNTGASTSKVIITTKIFTHLYWCCSSPFIYLLLKFTHHLEHLYFLLVFVSRERFSEHFTKLNTYPKSSILSWIWIQNSLLVQFQATCLFL